MQFKRVHTIFGSFVNQKQVFFLKRFVVLFATVILFQGNATCQCLPNIGFENGNFDNWVYSNYGLTGINNFNVNALTPTSLYIPLVINSFPQLLDPTCNVPRFTPNGSKYSIRLGADHYAGNSVLGRYSNQPAFAYDSGSRGTFGAQRMNYTFTVPTNKNDFAINFEFAVVFVISNRLRPGSLDEPRFSAKIYDYDAQQYLDCKTIDIRFSNPYINFKESTLWPSQYSLPWTYSTINLSGMAGKKLSLEFSSVDGIFEGDTAYQGGCYTYIDVDENCAASPITGNTYCRGDTSITLKGPSTPGYYTWYNSTFSKVLGKGNSSVISISPPPLPGTKLALVFQPTPGFGCTDTIYTTVQYIGDTIDLRLEDTVKACLTPGADLTNTSVTNGSSNGLSFAYYTDKYFSNTVTVPTHVQQTGSYYITATNAVGCIVTKPLYVNITDPFIAVNYNIPVVCEPNTINLTDPSIILSSTKKLTYSYWQDSAATIAVTNPQAVSTTGKYYIKGTTIEGCSVVSTAVSVSVAPGAEFILAPAYIVESPAVVNLTSFVNNSNQYQYSYWMDSSATITIQDPNTITTTGIYYIKGTSTDGCFAVKPVSVVITPPINVPNAFSPNGDGINDTWVIPYLQLFSSAIVEIYNRYGQPVFKSTGYYTPWDGKLNGKDLPIGTYYYIIKLNPQSKPLNGSITILK